MYINLHFSDMVINFYGDAVVISQETFSQPTNLSDFFSFNPLI